MTAREKELEIEVAMLKKQLKAMKSFTCVDSMCEKRKHAMICPGCGQIIRE
jgi:hypothetical protein